MITRDIRAFVSRDWQAARASKDAYWSDRIVRLGAIEGLRIADELRRQALAHNPAWPLPADRLEDRRVHERVSDLLRRADAARRR